MGIVRYFSLLEEVEKIDDSLDKLSVLQAGAFTTQCGSLSKCNEFVGRISTHIDHT